MMYMLYVSVISINFQNVISMNTTSKDINCASQTYTKILFLYIICLSEEIALILFGSNSFSPAFNGLLLDVEL